MDRIMIKATCSANVIKFRAIRRGPKSLDEVAVSRHVFEDLEEWGHAEQNEPYSRAVFQRNIIRGTVDVWLGLWDRPGCHLSGLMEYVVLDYEEMMAFVWASADPNRPTEWRVLTVPRYGPDPRITFHCNERLRECLDNKLVRHRLVKFLRNHIWWPGTDRIEVYSYSEPYSFSLWEYTNGRLTNFVILSLRGQKNMAKAYYAIQS